MLGRESQHCLLKDRFSSTKLRSIITYNTVHCYIYIYIYIYISLFAHTSYKVVHRKCNCIQTEYIKRIYNTIKIYE